MPDQPPVPPQPLLTFESAGVPTPDAVPACAGCQRAIAGEYYEAAGKVFCESCKAQFERSLTGDVAGGTRWLPALALGIGGGVLGALLWYWFVRLTGYNVGIIAIAVGWLVGRGVLIGSGHRGGRTGQVMAVVLTYVAVGAAYFAMAAGSSGGASWSTAVASPLRSLIVLVSIPVMINIMSMPWGLISLLIIFFALQQAWQMNRDVSTAITFAGPFRVGTPRNATPGDGHAPTTTA